ncbi:hypothetical protein [Actinoallomurus iriomotensis]|uniref:Uncharacterized protein n=1 Tax=Actinoallomurus iriomotensis TaxID=478107 RepID=A0A9W6S379_9ACTN|nr:hypothetical protein [Actinoallomurus iriomotensis]GLY87731.1 hypothetical protein Airi02_056600 [Actinoallomurus iriomotensis]
MGQDEWDTLPQAEKAFMINGSEHDILPGVWGDLPASTRAAPLSEVAAILLSLVDRGWLEVRRVEPWTAPDGRVGSGPGDLVPREQLPVVLADPREWEYPADPSRWAGALTLVETDAGRRISRRSAE